jgi:hypothetical protein
MIKVPYNISQEYIDGIKDGIKIANNVLKRQGRGLRVEIPKIVIDNQEAAKGEKHGK